MHEVVIEPGFGPGLDWDNVASSSAKDAVTQAIEAGEPLVRLTGTQFERLLEDLRSAHQQQFGSELQLPVAVLVDQAAYAIDLRTSSV